jgi:hypothetical protein
MLATVGYVSSGFWYVENHFKDAKVILKITLASGIKWRSQ